MNFMKSPKISMWLLCDYCVATVWLLCGYCVATVWLLCSNCVATMWLLCGYCVAAVLHIVDTYEANVNDGKGARMSACTSAQRNC